MTVKTYVGRVWKCAGREARGWVKLQSFGDFARLAAAYVGAVALFWILDLERFGVLSFADVREEVVIAVALVLVAIGLFVVAFVVALLFLAPYRVWTAEALRARLIENAETETDLYAAWAARDPLTLQQAACLWVGDPPPRSEGEIGERAHVMWLELRDAATKRLLPVSNPAPTAYQETMDQLTETMTGSPSKQ